jgi:hypothetical protein
VQVFKIKPSGFNEIKNKSLRRSIPTMLITGTAGIAIAIINKQPGETIFNPLFIIIPAAIVALGFGINRGVMRLKTLLDSYRLTITNNLITREQFNTPTISIYFNEVSEISQQKNGVLTIKGKESADQIIVLPQIDNHRILLKTLEQIKPLIRKDISFLERYLSFTLLLTLGSMVCVFTLNNKIIVAISGSILIALMIWSFVKTRNNKNVDNKTKNSLWLMFIVLASVLFVMFFKLSGMVDMQRSKTKSLQQWITLNQEEINLTCDSLIKDDNNTNPKDSYWISSSIVITKDSHSILGKLSEKAGDSSECVVVKLTFYQDVKNKKQIFIAAEDSTCLYKVNKINLRLDSTDNFIYGKLEKPLY